MPTNKLNDTAKRNLISKAHHLKPIVMLGNKGLTSNVLAEIDRALNDHQLIKVKLGSLKSEVKVELSSQIEDNLSAACLKIIGNNAIVYRKLAE